MYDYFAYDFSVITLKDNLITDPEVCKRIKKDPKDWEPYYLNLDAEAGYVTYKNGNEQIANDFADDTILNENPGFVDAEHGDFHLKKDSPAFELGFQQIPVDKIGLYVDEYREKLPE